MFFTCQNTVLPSTCHVNSHMCKNSYMTKYPNIEEQWPAVLPYGDEFRAVSSPGTCVLPLGACVNRPFSETSMYLYTLGFSTQLVEIPTSSSAASMPSQHCCLVTYAGCMRRTMRVKEITAVPTHADEGRGIGLRLKQASLTLSCSANSRPRNTISGQKGLRSLSWPDEFITCIYQWGTYRTTLQ